MWVMWTDKDNGAGNDMGSQDRNQDRSPEEVAEMSGCQGRADAMQGYTGTACAAST